MWKIRRGETSGIVEMRKEDVQQRKPVFESEYDLYTCYVCNLGDNEHVLLICDNCDVNCCHIYCDEDLADEVPAGDWFCLYCRSE